VSEEVAESGGNELSSEQYAAVSPCKLRYYCTRYVYRDAWWRCSRRLVTKAARPALPKTIHTDGRVVHCHLLTLWSAIISLMHTRVQPTEPSLFPFCIFLQWCAMF